MTRNLYSNGNGHISTLLSASLDETDTHSSFIHRLEEPVQIKGFAVTYDQKFNLGNSQSLAPAITIWVKSNASEGEAFDLHEARERVRNMARENVRAMLLRLQGSSEILFLGQPLPADGTDPIFVRTVSVSLVYKANLGDFNSIAPGYTDWAT